MKEIRRVFELGRPLTYSEGASKPITISRLELNMPKAKRLNQLGRSSVTTDYYLRVLSLMTGLPVKAIEQIDAADLSSTMDVVYEMLRVYHARRGAFLPAKPWGAG